MIDVFRVGVHIGMTSNANQVLQTMLRHLTGVQGSAAMINTHFGRMATLATGAVAAVAGFAALKGIIHLVEHAERLNHELTKLQVGARLTDAQTANARAVAFRVQQSVPGSNFAENVKMQRELFGVFGNMDTAQGLLPLVAQGSRAVSNYVDKDTDLAQIAIRSLELRGHITKDHKVDPEEFKTEFNALVRSIAASEGLVDPQKLFMFIRQAGPAARTMNAEEFWGKSPAIMNALGSGPAGTAVMSLYSQMVGHVVAGKRVAIAMEKAGMLTPGKWRTERGGKVVMDSDAVPDQAGFSDHPFTWLHDRIQELRERKGKDGKPLDVEGLMTKVYQLSSRATTARLIADIDANWPVIQNEESRWKRMPNVDVINMEQNEKDLSVNVRNFHEAWDALMTSLGSALVPLSIDILHRLTSAVNYLAKLAEDHPKITEWLLGLAGALAAFLAVGGTVAVITTLVGALTPIMGGIAALAGVAGLLTLGASLAAVAGALTVLAAIKLPEWISDAAKWSERQLLTPDEIEAHKGHGGRGLGTPDETHRNNKPRGSRQSYVPPAAGDSGLAMSGPIPVHVVNGRDLADGTLSHAARGAGGPARGPTGHDGSMSLFEPGFAMQ